MRILVGWIRVALPFVEIGEAIAVGILIENIGIGDGQTIFLEPLIWHRRMHLRGL